MRESNQYTGSQYARENGIGLAWIFSKLFTRGMKSSISSEADAYHQRNDDARKGKIIGRPAGRDAYHGKSAVLFQERSVTKTERKSQENDTAQAGEKT